MSDYIEYKMTDQQSKSARQSENVHEAHHQDDNSGSPANASEPKAITNIYYDCLERIFDFLDLKSLLNVAHTCKRLQIAAAAKFGDDFGEKIVHLNQHNIHFDDEEISLSSSRIDVFRGKNCFAFLRCFGAKIKHLGICHYDHRALSDSAYEHFNEYIIKYCADTLVSIKFGEENRRFWISNPTKPFKNVEKVVVSGYHDNLSHFVNCFPKLRHLEMGIDHVYACAEPLSFPNLEHLQLYGWMNQNALDLVLANPQLKTVSIKAYNCGMATQHLLNALMMNTSWVKLLLHTANSITPVDEDVIVQFAKLHPLLAELRLFEIKADQAIMFIRHLTSLKRFKFTLTDHPEYNRLLNQLDSKWKHRMEHLQIELTC